MICRVRSFLKEILHFSERPVKIKGCIFAQVQRLQVKNPEVEGDLLPLGGAGILESGANSSVHPGRVNHQPFPRVVGPQLSRPQTSSSG